MRPGRAIPERMDRLGRYFLHRERGIERRVYRSSGLVQSGGEREAVSQVVEPLERLPRRGSIHVGRPQG